MIIAGALLLFGSLFLVWSHQFSKGFLAQWGSSPALAGIPHDPTAWQLYSIADVLLALLAIALPVVSLIGGWRSRLVLAGGCAVALVFVIHALNVPPTNGASLLQTPFAVNHPTAGAGEGVAILGLATSLAGLLLTLGAE